VHAVQLEHAQIHYMDEASFFYESERAQPTQALIHRLLEAALESV
jgi:N-formylglutamate deformylase